MSVTDQRAIPTLNRQPAPGSNATFNKLRVDEFVMYDGGAGARRFKLDHDLMSAIRKATDGGTQNAVLLIALGIDDEDYHRVSLDYTVGSYDDAAHCIDEAIDALTLILGQLEVMRAVPDARATERNAFEIGAESQRLGLLDGQREV